MVFLLYWNKAKTDDHIGSFNIEAWSSKQEQTANFPSFNFSFMDTVTT